MQIRSVGADPESGESPEASAHNGPFALECAVFTRLITDQAPTEYVNRCYRDAHHRVSHLAGPTTNLLDIRLLSLARRGGVRLRAADAYARIFRPRSLLRRKLVLTLAILENAPPFHRDLDQARVATLPATMLHIAARMATFAASLALGVALVGGHHVVYVALGMDRPGATAGDT